MRKASDVQGAGELTVLMLFIFGHPFPRAIPPALQTWRVFSRFDHEVRPDADDSPIKGGVVKLA